MLWTRVLPALCVVAVVPTDSKSFLLAGPTNCTAPSGRPGDCVKSENCPEERRPMNMTYCGYIPEHSNALLFCCERNAPIKTTPITTPTPTAAPPPRTLPTDCGVSYGEPGAANATSISNLRNIAFGKKEAKEHAFPWAALIGHVRSGGVVWPCGGVLISTHHVLTAAHCVPSSHTNFKMVVRLGEHDPKKSITPSRQDRTVRYEAIHPERNNNRNDLALLTLDSPVRLDKSVQPICLPEPNRSLVGLYGHVVGWGVLDVHSDVQPPLHEALVQVIDSTECEEMLSHIRALTELELGPNGKVLCTLDPYPKQMDWGLLAGGPCRGDTGGPLSVRLSDSRYVLAGIVLQGIGCGNAEVPDLYTRVARYVDWIRSEVVRSHNNW